MAITRQRFEFALKELGSGDWEHFEKCASQFLAAEFPDLRSVGTGSGDRGRDAELFRPDGDHTVLIQYSVTPDWEDKIRATRRRIESEFSEARLLIYATSKVIGAKADLFIQNMRKGGLVIDIRDATWFADRLHISAQREGAAEDLAKYKVDPLLEGAGIIARSSASLNSTEEKTAFTYLSLQIEDDAGDKNLTKLAFEALVKAALRGTDSENRISREDVYRKILDIVPSQNKVRVGQLADATLTKLTKKAVRHWQKEDEFCLSAEEVDRQREAMAQSAVLEAELDREIAEIVSDLPHREDVKFDLRKRVRRVIDVYMLKKGEDFARAVLMGDISSIFDDDLKTAFAQDLSDFPCTFRERNLYEYVRNAIIDLTESPSPFVAKYLQRLSETYTLMAFLRETPDVQNVTKKMFSFGDVWLDTTIVLPLLAESLFNEPVRKLTSVVNAAREYGVKFHVTNGVLEEVYRHFMKCFAYINPVGPWQAGVPFMAGTYLLSGRQLSTFKDWSETFFGSVAPEEDIAEYLRHCFHIDVEDLSSEVDDAPEDLRRAVKEAWLSVHKNRRETDEFDIVSNRLVQHDVENYLGVIQRRSREGIDYALGHRCWWMTFDGAVERVHVEVSKYLVSSKPTFPVMSVDFLVRYLEFGPGRASNRNADMMLPPILVEGGIASIPAELLKVAEETRRQSEELPEYRVRRRIRDEMALARTQYGEMQRGGLGGLQNEYRNGRNNKLNP